MGYRRPGFRGYRRRRKPRLYRVAVRALQSVARQRRAVMALLVRGARRLRPGPELGTGQLAVLDHRRSDRGARSDPDGARAEARKGRQAAAAPAAAAPSQDDDHRAPRADSIRAMMLIRTYRVRGHLAANLDPLGLSKHEMPADLTPEYHGFSDADIDRPVYLGGTLGLEWATVREIVDILRAQLLRQCRPRIYAHRRCRGASLPAGADGGQGQGDRVHARGQEGDPEQGDRSRAVGEIPRQEICRHQALRPRWRREHDPRAGSGHQIWRRSIGVQRDRLSAWRIAAG